MSERLGTDAELMSVSIVAGPAAASLLSKLHLVDPKVGVLTSESSSAFGALTILKQSPASSPDQILAQIRNIAEQRAVDDLIILCEPDRPPMAYASLFAANNPATSSLATVAQLVSTTYAIETAAFLDTILSRTPNTRISPCFMAEQMEFVDQIVFDDDDSADFDLARAIALALNPTAQVLCLTEAAARWGKKHSTRPFDFNASLQRAGWRRLLDGEQEAIPISGRVTAFGYSARRPFHPERLWNFLQHHSQNVFRAKGFFWVASRMDKVGGLNLAGSDLHCSSAGNWWATRDAKSREAEMPDHAREQWAEPFGDRRQTFGVMALDVDPRALVSSLNACLLNDAEMSQGPKGWSEFPDPIPSWSHPHTHSHSHHHEHGAECDHDHDHDSEEHHCCHH
jgi:G3E family GTPase